MIVISAESVFFIMNVSQINFEQLMNLVGI